MNATYSLDLAVWRETWKGPMAKLPAWAQEAIKAAPKPFAGVVLNPEQAATYYADKDRVRLYSRDRWAPVTPETLTPPVRP